MVTVVPTDCSIMALGMKTASEELSPEMMEGIEKAVKWTNSCREK